MYLKLTYFFVNFILFSEKNYKKASTNVFSKSFISATYSWDTLQFNFEKLLDFDLQNLWTTILDSDCFYILDLSLKNTWTKFLDSDWFYYNPAGLLLQKSGNLLKLSVIQSRLASWISLGQAMFDVWKTRC